MTKFAPAAWHDCFARMEALLGWPLSSHQRADLQHFSLLLLQANRQFNLMGPSAEKDLLSRHLLDSVPLLPFFAIDSRVVDVGSGGGIPGIVLAILSQPPRTIHLIESVSKKARFLHTVVAALGLQARVQVFAMRAEKLDMAQKNTYDFVVSRALGSLAYGANLACFLLRPGGAYLALKGRNHALDLDGLRADPVRHFFQKPQVYPATGEGGSVVLCLNRLHANQKRADL